MRRPWRGATIERNPARAPGEIALELDGQPHQGNLLAPLPAGGEARLRVLCGQRRR